MAVPAHRELADVEYETAAALDELARGASSDGWVRGRIERIRRHLEAVEERIVQGPLDLQANAEDLREARHVLFTTEFPEDLAAIKLSLLHRLWQWEQFLR